MTRDLQVATSADGLHPRVAQGIDKVLSVQRPVVLAHIRSIRRSRPDASPEQIIRILERRYLTAVTSGGALVGASAAIPAVGIGTSLVLSGVETAGFLEASALFAQSVTELHGIALEDPERARTLVMTMMLGNGGRELLTQFAAQATGVGPSRGVYWGELVTRNLPGPVVGLVADRVKRAFLRRFAVTQGGSIVGRAIPFGIGAVVGGTGNHLMGRRVVTSARSAYGPAPAVFPGTLEDFAKPPKRPKAPKPAKAPTPPTTAKPPIRERIRHLPTPDFGRVRRALDRRKKTPAELQAGPATDGPAADAVATAPPPPDPATRRED